MIKASRYFPFLQWTKTYDGTVLTSDLLAAVIVAPLSVWAAPFGVRLAHRIPRRTLELAFAAFLATISIRFLIDLLG